MPLNRQKVHVLLKENELFMSKTETTRARFKKFASSSKELESRNQQLSTKFTKKTEIIFLKEVEVKNLEHELDSLRRREKRMYLNTPMKMK